MRVAPERIALLVLAFAGIAHAEPSAEEYFKQGREFLKAGKFAQACEQFEHSQKLDPALGTLYNIAECDVEIGKLAEALLAYRQIVSRDTNLTRRQAASDAAAKLEPRVSRVIIKSDPTLVLEVDGEPIEAEIATPIDVGRHKLIATKDAVRGATQAFTIPEEGKTITIVAKPFEPADQVTTVVKPKTEPVKPIKPKPELSDVPDDETAIEAPRSHRKLIAISTIGVGGAAVATGLVFGALASSRWSDAKAVCGGGTSCASQAAADQASALGDQAHSKATMSTIFMVAGGLVATAGVVLLVTTPAEHQVAVSALPTGDGGTFVLSGRF